MPYKRLASVIEDALCAQIDPELFFPDKGGSNAQAKEVCKACSIRPECLLEAIENDFWDGIWGGTSVRERQAFKRNQLKVAVLRQEVEKRQRERDKRDAELTEQGLEEAFRQTQQIPKVRSSKEVSLERRRARERSHRKAKASLRKLS